MSSIFFIFSGVYACVLRNYSISPPTPQLVFPFRLIVSPSLLSLMCMCASVWRMCVPGSCVCMKGRNAHSSLVTKFRSGSEVRSVSDCGAGWLT